MSSENNSYLFLKELQPPTSYFLIEIGVTEHKHILPFREPMLMGTVKDELSIDGEGNLIIKLDNRYFTIPIFDIMCTIAEKKTLLTRKELKKILK